MPTQKSLNQLLASLDLYQHAKNQLIPSVRIWYTVNFRVRWWDWPHLFLNMPTQKIFDQLLIFVNLYKHAKNQFILYVHSSDKVNFRVLPPDWPHPFLTLLNQKIFNDLLICVNLCQQAKNLSILEIKSILESRDQIGHTHFWPSQPKTFWSTFNFCEFVSISKELHCFIKFFWRNGWLTNPGIWLAETTLTYISEQDFSQI